MIVFSGTANRPLADKMMEFLGQPLGEMDIRRFPDGEIHCKIKDNVRGRDVFMVQPIVGSPNEMLMELLIMIDAARRGSANRITAVLPYYGYARQDRKDQPRVPITAKLVANLLVAAGANRVLTMDLHAQQIQGFFDIPVDHLHAATVLVKYLREMKLNKPLVVSPDTGGAKMAYAYSQMLGTDLAIVAKQRLGDAEVDAFSVVGNVKGCDVIMVDDMSTTCGTLCAAAKILKENGAASIRAAVTHLPLTDKGVERLKAESELIELVTTDTVPMRSDLDIASLPMKVTVLSIAELLGEAIRRIHEDKSVSSLFYS
ncbi:MAG: ribose-phosphate pyrophosphokinase [Kiritimatiellae bacterium]|nr:ribose-phosphate pyrophosphokinase [Kiritimatiellia bacterium]